VCHIQQQEMTNSGFHEDLEHTMVNLSFLFLFDLEGRRFSPWIVRRIRTIAQVEKDGEEV